MLLLWRNFSDVVTVWGEDLREDSGLPWSWNNTNLENDFFQVREKSGNFVVGHGNLERNKSGIFKLLAMTDYRKYAYVVQGKRMYFLASSPGTSSSSLGVFLKGKNLLPGEKVLPFKN